jgi:mono/diheme cytochrome c family protein
MDFCTTDDCVLAAQDSLDLNKGQAAVPVPFSAATDGRDHWLSAGEPHCADCHAAPFVEQSGNINAFPPFNYPQKASLFRYSRGHQDITCQGCHESTHGLYPVTPPGYVAGSTKAVDQTSWDQAAGMNTDGSHGPLKCGACHEVDTLDIPTWVDNLRYKGSPVSGNFDRAVSWMHTYTDEENPANGVCLNCHGDRTNEMREDDGRWKDSWMTHTMRNRVSRSAMDKVEIAEFGHVAGDPAFEDPRTTACRGCHDDEWSRVSCTGGESTEWKRHLTQGRVSASVWENVSMNRTGSTCGW